MSQSEYIRFDRETQASQKPADSLRLNKNQGYNRARQLTKSGLILSNSHTTLGQLSKLV